jgi:hypothetical protein
MKLAINYILRALCVLVFVAAAARLAGLLPAAYFSRAPWVAMALLAIHTIEVFVVFKLLRLYRGPLGVSVLLTLLFGVLHWKPLADARAAASRGR